MKSSRIVVPSMETKKMDTEIATQLIELSAQKFQEDTQYLLDNGWIRTDKKEIEGESVFSVWVGPDGKEYGHQNYLFGGTSWKSAIEKAESDLVHKNFGVFSFYTAFPELSERMRE